MTSLTSLFIIDCGHKITTNNKIMTEQKYIPIIQPSAQKNGLFFKLGAHPLYEIRKLSIRGRDNGLICVYNMGTRKCSLPGSTWRSYKPYYNMELTEIKNLINHGLKLITT